jgi:hypothetical protein
VCLEWRRLNVHHLGLYNPTLIECPLSGNLGVLKLPPPAPFIFYIKSKKTKSPKTAKNSRPFLGFSLKMKGYVEK